VDSWTSHPETAREWNEAEFDGFSVDEGAVVSIVQILPAGLIRQSAQYAEEGAEAAVAISIDADAI
jgi:hypothetical protein